MMSRIEMTESMVIMHVVSRPVIKAMMGDLMTKGMIKTMEIMTCSVFKSMSIMTRDMIKTMLAMIETMEIMTMKVVSSQMIKAMKCCIVANSVINI